MSDSTSQQTKSAMGVNVNQSAFERELVKKIRNKTKKIETIKALESKIKAEGIKPNEEQLSKIASRVQSEAEIAEIKSYLDLYNQSTSEMDKKE